MLEEGEAEIQEGSLGEEDSKMSKSTFSDVTYLHTGSGKSRKSIAVPWMSERDMKATVGKISAETVRNQGSLRLIVRLHCVCASDASAH